MTEGPFAQQHDICGVAATSARGREQVAQGCDVRARTWASS